MHYSACDQSQGQVRRRDRGTFCVRGKSEVRAQVGRQTVRRPTDRVGLTGWILSVNGVPLACYPAF
jgi:hypothetical protein